MEIRVQKLGRESGTGSGTGENPGQGRMAARPEGASTLNMEPSTGELGNRDESPGTPALCRASPRSPPSIHQLGLLTGATAAFEPRAVGAACGPCWLLAARDAYRITLAANIWPLAPGEQLERFFYWGIRAGLEHVERQPSRQLGGGRGIGGSLSRVWMSVIK